MIYYSDHNDESYWLSYDWCNCYYDSNARINSKFAGCQCQFTTNFHKIRLECADDLLSDIFTCSKVEILNIYIPNQWEYLRFESMRIFIFRINENTNVLDSMRILMSWINENVNVLNESIRILIFRMKINMNISVNLHY